MSFEATLDTGCYNKYLSAFDILAMHALAVEGTNDHLPSH